MGIYGLGRVFKRNGRYWIAFYCRNKEIRESAGNRTEAQARKLLKQRLLEVQGGTFIGPKQEKITVVELLDDLLQHLKNKGAKDITSLTSHTKPVRAFFPYSRAMDLTTAQIRKYQTERLEDGKAKATVNREMESLRRALNLARKEERLTRVPYFPMLSEADNVRKDFFDRGEFEAVRAQLPEYLKDFATFAYLTGWRSGAIKTLKWETVDRKGGEIRIYTSKNGRGRVIPLVGDLAAVIERRWEAREYETPDEVTHLSDWVFYQDRKRTAGRPVGDFRRAWRTACEEAGVPGRTFHSFRRSAVRDMTRSGVQEAVAMQVTGHRSRSIFQRYNITSTEDVKAALLQTDQHRAAMNDQLKTVPFPTKKK